MATDKTKALELFRQLKEVISPSEVRVTKDLDLYNRESDVRFVEVIDDYDNLDGASRYQLQARFSYAGAISIISTGTEFEDDVATPVKQVTQHLQISNENFKALALAFLEWRLEREEANGQ